MVSYNEMEFSTYCNSIEQNNFGKIASWPLRKVKLYELLYKTLLDEEKDNLNDMADSYKDQVSLETLGAICTYPADIRKYLLLSLLEILISDNPFDTINKLVNRFEPDPLLKFRNDYWICVSKYISERNPGPPFSAQAISFIKQIGQKGYVNQSSRQKKWLNDLIINDSERPEKDRLFSNIYIEERGFQKECDILISSDEF